MFLSKRGRVLEFGNRIRYYSDPNYSLLNTVSALLIYSKRYCLKIRLFVGMLVDHSTGVKRVSLSWVTGDDVPVKGRLTTMCSLPGVTWMGNAATVLSGRWGAVSRRAQEVGWSREAMYQQARRIEQAVA